MKYRILLPVVAALVLGACAKKHPSAPAIVTVPGPAATSPAGAVQRLAWTLVTRDADGYRALLTDDFAFVFAANDSVGNAFPGHALDRELDGIAVTHLLVGGGSQPPCTGLSLVIDPALVAMPDPRPGKAARWHQCVRTHLDLRITAGADGSQDLTAITGYAYFFLTRGDSAVFLPGREGLRDSTRWFVSRWEDETLVSGAPGKDVVPTRNFTLGDVKAGYLYSAAPAR